MNSATYDNANQRTAQDGATLTYDANGNLTKDASGATFTWNQRDQLASTIKGSTSASFVYDGTGRRQRKTVNGQATDFVYDGSSVVQERRGGAVYADLLTGGLDQTFRRTTGSGSSDLLTDGLGSTLALTDPFGLPTTTYTYDPFGNASQQGAASDNPFQYTGRENDGTGLQYNRNRYYHPGMGRFISNDPIGLGGGDPNLYAYVGNDPMNATDPLGLYMEINDHLIVTPGGPHITRPYEWMSPLDQVFSGPFAPPLVGWDSYRRDDDNDDEEEDGCDEDRLLAGGGAIPLATVLAATDYLMPRWLDPGCDGDSHAPHPEEPPVLPTPEGGWPQHPAPAPSRPFFPVPPRPVLPIP
jgi:RHS repeat-associated protein